MTFATCLKRYPNDLFRASLMYCQARGWKREQWYVAWQTTDLPREVEEAIRASQEA